MIIKYSHIIRYTPIAMIIGIFFFFTVFKTDVFDAVANFYDENYFNLEHANNLNSIISPLVKNTRFTGKVNLIEPPQRNKLNIYIATKPLPRPFDSIECNCAYVGSSIILCDEAFLDSFSNAINFTKDSFYGQGASEIWEQERLLFEQANAHLSQVLSSWILGHEIGHAVLHDAGNANRRRKMTRRNEIEADRFFLDQLFATANSNQRQPMYAGISQFIFSIIGISYTPPESDDVPGKAIIAPSKNGTHPPWIIRAFNLGQTMTDLNESSDSNDFYESLRSHVIVASGGLNIGSFCDYENLREKAADLQQNRQNVTRATD